MDVDMGRRSRSRSRGAIRRRTSTEEAEAAAAVSAHVQSMPSSWQRGEPYILWTDFISPDPDTDTGHTLSRNAATLKANNCTFNEMPLQMIDIMNPPAQLMDNLSNAVHILASPAPNMPDGRRSTGHFTAFTLKRDGFYHWMWHTPSTSAIVMTYSASACKVGDEPRMDFWMSPIKEMGTDNRNLWVGFVHFETYRPSAGLHDDFYLSQEAPDTMAAIYAPPSHIKKFVYAESPGHEGLLDLSLTIQAWRDTCSAFPVVTYSAWTGELEVNLASASLAS